MIFVITPVSVGPSKGYWWVISRVWGVTQTWLWPQPKIDNSKQGTCQQGDKCQKNLFFTLAVRFRYFSSSPLHSHSSLVSFIINWIHIFKNPDFTPLYDSFLRLQDWKTYEIDYLKHIPYPGRDLTFEHLLLLSRHDDPRVHGAVFPQHVPLLRGVRNVRDNAGLFLPCGRSLEKHLYNCDRKCVWYKVKYIE